LLVVISSYPFQISKNIKSIKNIKFIKFITIIFHFHLSTLIVAADLQTIQFLFSLNLHKRTLMLDSVFVFLSKFFNFRVCPPVIVEFGPAALVGEEGEQLLCLSCCDAYSYRILS
jgi:hypothetical protein